VLSCKLSLHILANRHRQQQQQHPLATAAHYAFMHCPTQAMHTAACTHTH